MNCTGWRENAWLSAISQKKSTTSVYPAKYRPGSGTTKLDSGAQKRLRRSRMEGYGPRPKARARLARAAVVPPPNAPASSRTVTAGICARQRASPVETFSKWAILHRFPKFCTLRVEIFRMFFIRSRLPMTPMNDEKFRGNRSALFREIRKTDTHTHRQTRQLYIYRGSVATSLRYCGILTSLLQTYCLVGRRKVSKIG